uniref:SFRICE_015703 n=1 Tax=Spodoptera frugiperda TaxID=7108 RepID=A0A2H1VPR9_SPOFR
MIYTNLNLEQTTEVVSEDEEDVRSGVITARTTRRTRWRCALRGRLSRPALVQALVLSEGDWNAVSSFCEAIMLAKEEAGHVSERTSSRPSRRERHSGRQGSRDNFQPPIPYKM